MQKEQKELKLSIPTELWERLNEIASTSNQDVSHLVLSSLEESFPPFPENPQREQMKQESAAYETLFATLKETYLGEYVAIHGGELVDHDIDPVKLHYRLAKSHPNKIVLCRKVEAIADNAIWMRSPKLEPAS